MKPLNYSTGSSFDDIAYQTFQWHDTFSSFTNLKISYLDKYYNNEI